MSTAPAHKLAAAANAREARKKKRMPSIEVIEPPTPAILNDETFWPGSVNHFDYRAAAWLDIDEETDSDVSDTSEGTGDENEGAESDLESLDGKDLLASFERLDLHQQRVEALRMDLTKKEWKDAESGTVNHIRSSYTGNSQRTVAYHAQLVREKEILAKKSRNSQAASNFRSFFNHSGKAPSKVSFRTSKRPRDEDIHCQETPPLISTGPSVISPIIPVPRPPVHQTEVPSIPKPFLLQTDRDSIAPGGYLSDETDSDISDDEDVESEPPTKQVRRADGLTARAARAEAKRARAKNNEEALTHIQKLIKARQTIFTSGHSGLQATRARAIESHLRMMVKGGRAAIESSQRSAEVHGFRPAWGGRQIRRWTSAWVNERKLPKSMQGRHVKSWSLLDDPAISEELKSFVRTNKWAMNPAKLMEYTKSTIVTDWMKKYVENTVSKEMPTGLMKYLELEIMPRMGYKAAKGISETQARVWLKKNGFEYTNTKKEVFYDGHERPDVVKDRQDRFLPRLFELRHRIVEYDRSNLDDIVEKAPLPPGVHQLILCPQDEMTAQAHDGKRKAWIMEGAGQGLDYGKNYEGYWNGEMFVQQIKEKIIPAFEALHDPNQYRGLFFIDNSQGHAAYSQDALVATRMNLRPGGKQAIMRDGWFINANGCRVPQSMVMSDNVPKGMKMVLEERGLWRKGLLMKCDTGECCDEGSCCAQQILQAQPDFREQKSLVQETIESRGHYCIFLPKYHFKRYLRDNCDYTWDGLNRNMPEALASVSLRTFKKWQNRTFRWAEAYSKGLDAKEAQFEVKKFSSRVQKSHRRVGEAMGRIMD
ncbi:hypothetical protein DL96DRAFT_1734433 [Flagelloscypha sp. PMI_526]|nr:hypothetical protein DL96DRAFT_1734433 [Flagelloscypha sp. PMI_526]